MDDRSAISACERKSDLYEFPILLHPTIHHRIYQIIT